MDRDVLVRIHQALIGARDNASEMLDDHIAQSGCDTKKNKFIADMYEKEVREINDLLEYTANNGGVLF